MTAHIEQYTGSMIHPVKTFAHWHQWTYSFPFPLWSPSTILHLCMFCSLAH